MIFKCPGCGGSNDIEIAANEFITCTYCGSSAYIDIEGIISVYSFKSLINPEEVPLFLKKDFERTGFSEQFKVLQVYPVYIPFWDFDKETLLKKGSSRFRKEEALRPSEEKQIFNFESVAESIEIIEPDTIPGHEGKRKLCYLPFFRIIINYKGEEYDFFVNGMNGQVSGDPIPFVPVKEAGALFPQFLAVFLVAFIVNFLFDNLLLAVFSNLVSIYLLFSFSISKINRKLYKNER
jgi:hypothetical protein